MKMFLAPRPVQVPDILAQNEANIECKFMGHHREQLVVGVLVPTAPASSRTKTMPARLGLPKHHHQQQQQQQQQSDRREGTETERKATASVTTNVTTNVTTRDAAVASEFSSFVPPSEGRRRNPIRNAASNAADTATAVVVVVSSPPERCSKDAAFRRELEQRDAAFSKRITDTDAAFRAKMLLASSERSG